MGLTTWLNLTSSDLLSLTKYDNSVCFFLDEFLVLKKFLILPKLALYFIHYHINSFKFTADEIMAKVQDQFQEDKMDFKTGNSSKEKVNT